MRHGNTETRHRKIENYVGTVQYTVVIDKRVRIHTADVPMLEEGTFVTHSNSNSNGKCMRHEAASRHTRKVATEVSK